MKSLACLSFFAAALLAGCCSKSPYDYAENWLIREDPVRTFVAPVDIIYLQGDLYTRAANVPKMLDYAKVEVGGGRFSGTARVFAPLVASSEDLEAALKWYFKYHHGKGRPFVFIGEGEGGKLLQAYEQNDAEGLKKAGLVASYYTEKYRKGFVSGEMVKEIKDAVARARFREIWGKEMPEDMLRE